MKESQLKLGRLVQCFCSDCNWNEQGFQWILPRTKSKHVMYEKSIKYKDTQAQKDMDMIQQNLAFISINSDHGGIVVKKKPRKPAFRLSMALQRKLNQIGYKETLVVLKEFTVTSSPSSFDACLQDIPVTDYY